MVERPTPEERERKYAEEKARQEAITRELREFAPEVLYWTELSELDAGFGGLLVSYLATKEKVGQLSETQWYDPELGRFDNKTRMKEIGGAVFLYRAFLGKSVIQTLANLLEVTWAALKRDFEFRYDLWKPEVEVEFERDARIIRSLANVIKHNDGIIDSPSSKSAAYLVNEGGFAEGFNVETDLLADRLDVQELIYRGYIYCLGLVTKVSGQRNATLSMKDPKRRTEVLSFLVPRVLGLV